MSKNEIIDMLNVYRTRLKEDYEKPGWNIWALCGALSSLVWLFIDLASRDSNIDLKTPVKLLIIVVLFETSFLIRFDSNKRGKYVEIAKEIRNPRIIFSFVSLLLLTVFALFEISFRSNLKYVFFFFLFSLDVVFASFFIQGLSGRTLRKVIYRKRDKQWRYFLFFLFLSLTALSSYSIIDSISSICSWDLWKLLLIYAGIYILVGKLLDAHKKYPLIDQVDYLIDSVVFEQISEDEVVKKLKLIVFGLEFRDIISPNMERLIILNEMIRAEMNLIKDLIDKFGVKKDAIERKALHDAIETHLGKIQNDLFEEMKREALVIKSKLKLGESEKDVRSVNALVLDELDSITKYLKELVEQLEKREAEFAAL